MMKRMKIIGTKDHCGEYRLQDEQGKIYTGFFAFISVDSLPEKGDYLFWDEKNYTDPEECSIRGELSPRYYGPYTNKGYVRKGEHITGQDILVVVKKDVSYVLHRYYG